ncbi:MULTISPECIES: DUF354 domain-containing protein [unclassified Haladaptatus]|uniref:DUF354 domain-containing protein n=1 Tax=unclassified Haladaptatus TaxID=2622732 RepID=UPI0023E89BFD|nr:MULTISPECIES: DUF354 domain-containing protein [unclassified Haladaptatus]
MRYLFFTNTPAHVHLYKHAVRRLQADGHEVLILGRDYGVTVSLLEYYDLPYLVYGSCGPTKGSLLRNLPRHFARILRLAREFSPNLVFGMGSYAAFAGAVSRAPVVLILDSEPTSLDHRFSRRFATTILTPHAFRKDLGQKHFHFTGFKETAYLHPDVFVPNPGIRDLLGLDTDERFAIVRFNAFGSHHDVGHAGFSPAQRRELLTALAEYVTVFVSDESESLAFDDLPARRFDLHPGLMHDALAAADLLVADTQTMVTEAALLGTPAIRSNSWVGADDMGNFTDLAVHGLIYNVREFDTVLTLARDLVATPDAKAEWAEKRDAYIADKVNLTDLIVEVAAHMGAVEGIAQVERGAGVRPAP